MAGKAKKAARLRKQIPLEKLQLEMKDTIEGLGLAEVVSMSSRNNDLRLLMRVQNERAFLLVLEGYLKSEGDWYSFVGKKYFIHNGRMVYGWVMILESDDINSTVQSVRRLLMSSHRDLSSEGEVADSSKERGEELSGGKMPFGLDYTERFGDKVRTIS